MPAMKDSEASSLRGIAPSNARKILLLVLFCLAQFLEAFNASAVFVALPSVARALALDSEGNAWLISAYQLTFASFLLVSGRISDVYSAKYVFLSGCALFGAFSLASGFLSNEIALLVVRALAGITAALTIPSALHLIVNLFTTPREQAQAIATFGAMAALGNVLGLVIGALLVKASWRWIFWIGGVVGIPVSVTCALLIPGRTAVRAADKPKHVDYIGVTTVTTALVLLIFAVTSGSGLGWSNARFIAPFVVSWILISAFFAWENIIPEKDAALPPRMWKYRNFVVLSIAAVFPFFWFSCAFFIFTTLFQSVFGWNALITAVHFLPLGIVVIFVIPFAGRLLDHISAKYAIMAGYFLISIGTILLAFADRRVRYWSFCFPGFIIGSLGVTLVFVSTNVTIFRVAPAQEAGAVGAIFNSALQIGTAIWIPVVSAIQSSVELKAPGTGHRSAYWFVLAGSCVEFLIVMMFYQKRDDIPQPTAAQDEVVVEVPEHTGDHRS